MLYGYLVINDEAGSAEMECRVISPSGRVIPSHVVNTDRGMKVKYTPEEPGVYYVHTYIGGVEIPGEWLKGPAPTITFWHNSYWNCCFFTVEYQYSLNAVA